MNTDWLVNYYIDCPEITQFAIKLGEKLCFKKCNICGSPVSVPVSMADNYDGYVCTSCCDDALHDYVERG
jgi:hypothetical protein